MSILKTIVTHSGSFHADEALAVFMLKLLPSFSSHKIIRTRDPEIIKQADIVVDVGGEYSPKMHRYDHHQRDFESTYSKEFDVKLSSAGLIYKHFGTEVVSKILSNNNIQSTKQQIDEIVFRIYKKLILSFDGVDNGVSRFPPDIKPKYEDPTSIASRVSRLNIDWNQEYVEEEVNTLFLKAVEITGEELVYWVNYFLCSNYTTGKVLCKRLASCP